MGNDRCTHLRLQLLYGKPELKHAHITAVQRDDVQVSGLGELFGSLAAGLGVRQSNAVRSGQRPASERPREYGGSAAATNRSMRPRGMRKKDSGMWRKLGGDAPAFGWKYTM